MNVDEKPNEKGHSNVITKETNKEPQENAMINNKSTKIALFPFCSWFCCA